MSAFDGGIELEDIAIDARERDRAMNAIGYDGYDIDVSDEPLLAASGSRWAKVVAIACYAGTNVGIVWLVTDVLPHAPKRDKASRLAFATILSLLCYLMVQFSDPGYVPPPGRDSPPALSDYEARREAAAAATAAFSAQRSDRDAFSTLLPWPPWPPMRAAYCRVVKRWMRVFYTYDHYCPLVSAPIGERNRFRFWLFLLAQTLSLGQAAVLAAREESVRWNDIFDGVETALVVGLALWLVFIAVAIFFLFHTFLALTNITSHEFLRASTLDYLHNTEDFDLPFSRGLCGNIRTFIFQARTVELLSSKLSFTQDGLVAALCCRKWKPIPWVRSIFIDRDSEDWWNHPWQNRFWSCC
ncbi:hypothetical protein CTAYLR_003216 [Chrysophaeum taylorii]|uniref:Palmitoyltransferase n=1 Tax=Chrysophaeum taylorii TaxID=2483200 RepID=A0AAD7UAU0_9STRA|nr:hypothetical protein CTAYLR_003216 [Chrysophaeum taylorii]